MKATRKNYHDECPMAIMHVSDVPFPSVVPKVGIFSLYTVPWRMLSLVWSNNSPNPTLLIISKIRDIKADRNERERERERDVLTYTF